MKIKNLLDKLDKIYKSHNYTEKENNFGKKTQEKNVGNNQKEKTLTITMYMECKSKEE